MIWVISVEKEKNITTAKIYGLELGTNVAMTTRPNQEKFTALVITQRS